MPDTAKVSTRDELAPLCKI